MLGTVALIKALLQTESDIFGGANEFAVKGKRTTRMSGGYKDHWGMETKALEDMTDAELIYALRNDAMLRDIIRNAGVTDSGKEKLSHAFGQLKVSTPVQEFENKLVEGFSGVEIEYNGEVGVISDDILHGIAQVYMEQLQREHGPLTAESSDYFG